MSHLAGTLPPQVGDFAIGDVLGRGANGAVYDAIDLRTQSAVAFKTVELFDASLLPAIRREIQALSALSHPGVVGFVEGGTIHGMPWLAMEKVDGEELSDHCQRHWYPSPSSEEEEAQVGEDGWCHVLTVLKILSDALAYIHGEGIVHRDLKSENVLVRHDGQPVLVDFGVATTFGGAWGRERLRVETGTFGNVFTMSPEQLRGELVDARADLYALGCMMYELLTGYVPFGGDSLEQIIQGHLEEQPIPPRTLVSSLPEELSALILSLLSKQPSSRPGFANDVSRVLIKHGATGSLPSTKTYVYRPAFIGRQQERGTITEALTSAAEGRGQMVLLTGPGGIGKTRLAMESGRCAAQMGLQVWAASCTGDQRPLASLRGPLLTIDDACREAGPETAARLFGESWRWLSQHLPHLNDHSYTQKVDATPPTDNASQAPKVPALDERARELSSHMLAALGEIFAAVCCLQPGLLVIDDLQRADEVTLQFLQALTQGGMLQQLPLAIVGTIHTDLLAPPQQELLASPGTTEIQLSPLDASDIAALTSEMIAMPAPPGLSLQLFHNSQGNPLFVSAYLQEAVSDGLIWRNQQGHWRCAIPGDLTLQDEEPWPLPLPDSLQELLQARLDALTPNSREVLALLSVWADDASTSGLLAILQQPEAELFRHIQLLLDRQILREDSGGRLPFVHEALREMTYAGISPSQRRDWHLQIAQFATAKEAHPDQMRLDRLGHHWAQAGRTEEARAAYLKAARQAIATGGLQQAAYLYQQALAQSPQESPIATDLLLEMISRATLHIDLHRAIAQLEQVHTRLAKTSTSHEAQRMTCQTLLAQGLWMAHELPRSRALLEDALVKAQGDATTPTQIATLTGRLAIICDDIGDTERAHALYQDALNLHQKHGQPLEEAKVLGNLAGLLVGQGKHQEALAMCLRSVALCQDHQEPFGEGRSQLQLAILLASMQRHHDATAAFAQAGKRLQQAGTPRWQATHAGYLADYQLSQAQPTKALASNQQKLQLLQKIGDRRGVGLALLFRAKCLRLAQSNNALETPLEAAAQSLREAQLLLQLSNLPIDQVACLCEAGHLALASQPPQPKQAREAIQQAQDILDQMSSPHPDETNQAIQALTQALSAHR